jgi:TfoX/Sxy family transcriptional regulator of competence genes
MEILSNLTYVDPKMLENIHFYQDKLGEIQDYRILIADYSSFCKKNMLKRTSSMELFQKKQTTLIEDFKQNLNAFITVCMDALSFRIVLATPNEEVTKPDKTNDLNPT